MVLWVDLKGWCVCLDFVLLSDTERAIKNILTTFTTVNFQYYFYTSFSSTTFLFHFILYFINKSKSPQFEMKAIEVRLVGRFRFEKKLPGDHQHLIYLGVHTQNDSYVFMKGD